MLSKKEKSEMLEDSKSIKRRRDFKAASEGKYLIESLDEYLVFLNDIQEIFAPFEISKEITVTKFNKL